MTTQGEHRWTAPSAYSKIPLARQIALDLSEQIRSGQLPSGGELPTEAALAVGYRVNRLTVRQALTELVQQGLVMTTRGRRAVVRPSPVRYRLDHQPGASLSSSMAKSGVAVRHEVRSMERVDATDAPFPLEGTKSCIRFSYRRWVADVPWSRSCTWVPVDLAPRTWDGAAPILDMVSAAHALKIRRAIRSFVAFPARYDDAEQLDVPVGAALLGVSGTSIDQAGRTIAAVRHHVRGDRAEYLVNLA